MGQGIITRGALQLFAIAALVLPGVALLGQDEEELPPQFAVEFVEPEDVQWSAESGMPYELYVGGELRHLLIEPVDLRSSRFQVTMSDGDERRTIFKAPPRTFKGKVIGDDGSAVRLSIIGGGVRGYVRTTGDWTFIRPVPPSAALAVGEHMLFTDKDLGESLVGTCAGVRSPKGMVKAAPASADPDTAPLDMGVFEVAVDADFEFFSAYADPVTEIESILNEVDGIYEAELLLSLEVVHINVWSTPADPYDSTDADLMLDEFRGYWSTNMTGVARDTAHLFTGKDLDGLTVGLAFLDAVCKSFGYGLTQNLSTASLVPLVVAHELGHNLGSDHDPSPAATHYIMYPSISTANLREFTDGSEAQIAAYLSRSDVTCVETVAGLPQTPKKSSGGPVDPLLLIVLAGGALTYRLRSGHGRR